MPSHPPCQHTHTHTCTSPALPQPDYDTRTHAHAHAHHQHPGKADLSLSWITDIHMAPCSQNNLIPLTPSLRVYNKAYVCVRFLSDSVWLIRGWNPQQVSSSPFHGFGLHCSFCTAVKEEEEEGGEGEITFSTGRDCTCIIHGMEMNLHRIYRFLITSALCHNEYAWWLQGDTDWLSSKMLLVKLNLLE